MYQNSLTRQLPTGKQNVFADLHSLYATVIFRRYDFILILRINNNETKTITKAVEIKHLKQAGVIFAEVEERLTHLKFD